MYRLECSLELLNKNCILVLFFLYDFFLGNLYSYCHVLIVFVWVCLFPCLSVCLCYCKSPVTIYLQIQDVATSSRMTTLGSRSKRLQASILQPLEQLQNEILYHLTALELQKDPWAKQVNQTLNHLRNIQEYLEKTAGEICDNQTRIYTER